MLKNQIAVAYNPMTNQQLNNTENLINIGEEQFVQGNNIVYDNNTELSILVPGIYQIYISGVLIPRNTNSRCTLTAREMMTGQILTSSTYNLDVISDIVNKEVGFQYNFSYAAKTEINKISVFGTTGPGLTNITELTQILLSIVRLDS